MIRYVAADNLVIDQTRHSSFSSLPKCHQCTYQPIMISRGYYLKQILSKVRKILFPVVLEGRIRQERKSSHTSGHQSYLTCSGILESPTMSVNSSSLREEYLALTQSRKQSVIITLYLFSKHDLHHNFCIKCDHFLSQSMIFPNSAIRRDVLHENKVALEFPHQ